MKGRAERELETLDRVMKAISHPARRKILLVLQARGGSMTSSEIAARFSCSWPTTTRHLRVLEKAGLVTLIREGREAHYRCNQRLLREAVGGWLKWFSQDKEAT